MTFISDLFRVLVCESLPKINAQKGNQMTKITFSESNLNNPSQLCAGEADRGESPTARKSVSFEL